MKRFLLWLEEATPTDLDLWEKFPWIHMRVRRTGKCSNGKGEYGLFYDQAEGEYLVGSCKGNKIYLKLSDVEIKDSFKTLEQVQEKYKVDQLGTWLDGRNNI